MTRLVLGIMNVLCLTACARVLYVPNAANSAPSIRVSFFDVSDPAAPKSYADVGTNRILYVPAGKTLAVIVRADGTNGVSELSVVSSVNGHPVATADVTDQIDSKGYIAGSLIVAGTNGSGGIGNQPIQIQLSSGNSATVFAMALAPPAIQTAVEVQVKLDCQCPFEAVFNDACVCGCLPSGPVGQSVFTDLPMLPMCGTSCCKSGDQCIRSMCQVADPSLCENGNRCLNPLLPVCRKDNLCYPY